MNRLLTTSPLSPPPTPYTSWSYYRALWKPESRAFGTGIQLKEFELPLTIGIQNPSFTNKEFWIQYLESGTHKVESTLF